MFLKQKTLNYGENNIVIHELSALQRVEYFDFLVEQSEHKAPEKNNDDIKRTAFYLRLSVEANAWLVSCSLQQGSQEVNDVYKEVINTWPPSMLESVAKEVLLLSDMLPNNPSSKSSPPEENGEPTSYESLEK
ncbi:phage tail assembly chaperone G [Proteus penneri]|uniref:Phage minor tail protein G n=1 Tax=Proteus penneri TaxID=102862 RepID=A0ABS0W2H1_9GAMM|nr:phage minor tail protein G [Proteus penneri]MBJ2116134.1 phage minor tail protein G [Proteus penneri]MCO8052025.1 phage minor tail protein G [Proteus penneri]